MQAAWDGTVCVENVRVGVRKGSDSAVSHPPSQHTDSPPKEVIIYFPLLNSFAVEQRAFR